MKPEKLCASYEPCARLVELGVKLDSFFVHLSMGTNEHMVAQRGISMGTASPTHAPTAGELGEVLQMTISQGKYSVYDSLGIDTENGKYLARYNGENMDEISYLYEAEADTMPDALIGLLLGLLEQGHITADEINKGGRR